MIIPSGFGQVNLLFSGAGVPNGAQVTFGIALGGAWETPAEAGLAIGVLWANAGFDDHMATTVVLDQILVKYGPNDIGPSALVDVNVPGVAAGDTLPNTAFLITKTTGLGGRRGRGRWFVPGPVESEVANGGTVSAAVANAMTASFGAFALDLGIAEHEMVLLHAPSYTWAIVDGQPKRIPDDPGTAPAPTVVTGGTCSTRLATQRRRLRD